MTTFPTKLIPTILSGGAGSRLWPVSRELHPKPFIRLADGQSLLHKAFLRGTRLPGVTEILTITNSELYFKTKDEFAEVYEANLPTAFVLEPFGHNTAAAVEHWIVVSGSATVTKGEREIGTNESTFIPSGNKHRLENATGGPLGIIEVQSASYWARTTSCASKTNMAGHRQ